MAIHNRINAPVDGNPFTLLGVYKTETEIPEDHLLPNLASKNRNAESLWWDHANWMELTESTKRHYTTAWNAWSNFCLDRGRHPAFPYVDDIEMFLSTKTDRSPNHQYNSYFRPLYRWFKYLMWHAETCHRYNPVVLAVCNTDGVARANWIHARVCSAKSFTEKEMEEWQHERDDEESLDEQ